MAYGRADTWSTFEGIITVRTAKAFMFQSYYWAGPLWFPNSQSIVEPDGEDTHVIKVKDWLCKKNDLQEFTAYDEAAIERMSEI